MNEEEMEVQDTEVQNEVVQSQTEEEVFDEEDEDDGIQVVNIDLYINNTHYVGTAAVDEDENVDLSNFSNLSELVYYHGNYCGCKVKDVLEGQALYEADYMDNIEECSRTGFWADECFFSTTYDGDRIFTNLTEEFDGELYYVGDGRTERYRRYSDDIGEFWAPDWYWDDRYWCDCCNCYVDSDDYYGDGECCWCHEENDPDEDTEGVIEDYSESHYHSPIFFGDYKDKFIGLGFELEVDCSSSNQHRNGETAAELCSSCDLESDEMRFAHDGSLNYGFECISQPHTVKAFWDNADKWRKMLSYLAERGYRSHDGGTCGLHVHVSRGMFGKTEIEQDRAIAKVYTFFDENWDNIVKISRRTDFGYCRKNQLNGDLEYYRAKTKYEAWRKKSKGEGGHHVALNNSNETTFEYRLGRGTLNAWSFFSWIDFVITLTRNARRINIEKVTSNDLLSWLGGIKESTAKYIYKRGAFRNEMLALFPNIEWETDLTESN